MNSYPKGCSLDIIQTKKPVLRLALSAPPLGLEPRTL